MLEQRWKRVIIESVYPEIDDGRFPVKRVVGETVTVEADIFTDGHDQISAVLLYRPSEQSQWIQLPMDPLPDDRWRAAFPVEAIGRYCYTLRAWVDPFKSWLRDLRKRLEAGQEVAVDLQVGVGLVEGTARRAGGEDAERLRACAATLAMGGKRAIAVALDPDLGPIAFRYPDLTAATDYGRELEVVVDRPKARYSTWYELFPRSVLSGDDDHGSFSDLETRLPYIASLGFDVLYLPPIHPIGTTFRKGPNNEPGAGEEDPGSPWAIGSDEGGHKAIDPKLGTVDDFRRLVARATDLGLEVALDLAFQASPDHPYVREHPEWFRHRPDGTIQYAENPPKKYQDIYPFDFEGPAWRELWQELKNVTEYWIDQGVRIFRVDNPHTKPFTFWEWLIGEIRKSWPEVIFLAEAFTRPRVMQYLAKLGFTQSYSYFAWRNTQWELTRYFTQLTTTEVAEYYRPNLWPNTPDILTEYLQTGGRPAFITRLILAATLGASYGIYGPAFELMEGRAREWGSEEYLDSEKYQIWRWDIDRPDSLRELISLVNRIRRDNPALQTDRTLRFHPVDNEQLICYSKHDPNTEDAVLVVVNLDPHYTQSGWVDMDLDELGIDPSSSFQLHDLLSEARYLWHGARNYVEINPHAMPAQIFRIRRRVRTEREFEYYL